jgi:hypothetical protein
MLAAIAIPLSSTLGGSLLKILWNVRIGQCQRYSGKLISPNQTRGLPESIALLNQANGPAEMIRAAPTVGSSAHHPGN